NANNNNQSGSTDCTAGSGADVINFNLPFGVQTINLTGVLPNISDSVTINGLGANRLILRRNTGGEYRILQFNGGITAAIQGLTISNGVGTNGPGGILSGATLTITNCAITGNQASGVFGGGIFNVGTMNIVGSTISGNTAGDGAGLMNQNGSTTLTNTTISGNTATSFAGGIENLGAGGIACSVTLLNCTVTGNTGPTEGGIATGNTDDTTSTITTLKNTIVANNSNPNLSRFSANTQVVSQGNNLTSDNGAGLLNQPSDKINTNPLLSALGNNGGTTQTHTLLSNSPAINAGNNTGAPATDQRGVGRPQAGTVDIGAVESGLQFYPLPAPVRLLETRLGFAGCVNPGTTIAANSVLTVPARTVCSGVPSDAVAITGNVTVVPSAPGFITLYPSDATRPIVANSNFNINEITNNVFTTGLGASDGALNIFASGTTHVIMDVTGYYAPPSPSGLYFHPLPTPVRLLETRANPANLSGCIKTFARLVGTGNPNANPNLDLSVQGRSPVASPCNSIPATAQVLIGNATTVVPSAGGFLTIYPSDALRPTVASSNYAGNDVINGPFAVRLGADGKFKVFTLMSTDLVIDILGYYSPDATDANGPGQYFNQIPRPVRLLETRANPANLPGCIKPGGRLQSQTTTYVLQATGTCDSTNFGGALSVVGNATVVTPDNGGFLTIYPSGQPPTIATSNFGAGGAYNRHFYTGVDATTGFFNIFLNLNNPPNAVFTSDLVIDVSGYFAP
ncbi:MAG TPA: right-handed parallel beta-helix repeat-containing protein, partial [Blastocatellia bacterium]|nr:right-handed parallel beta-helix repeat-containing protein [Blastocatellia bacterium]